MAKVKKQKERDIGFKVASPAKTCNDGKCPFHGSIKLRGKSFFGTVVKAEMQKSAVVMWVWKRKVPKYERFEKVRTKIKVHNPACINAEKADFVRVAETRPLSKTKHFVIIEKLSKDLEFRRKEDSKDKIERGKQKTEEGGLGQDKANNKSKKEEK